MLRIATWATCVLLLGSGAANADSMLSQWAKQKVASEFEKRQSTKAPGGAPVSAVRRDARSVDIDYGFYQVNYSCEHRGFNYVTYATIPDRGSIPRYEPFFLEPALEQLNCASQKTADTYKQKRGQEMYHRGHGNHQNIWDHSERLMALTNRMTNVVPHHGVQNTRGLWRELERREECARDKTTVIVFLGNDWGADPRNDHFVKSHGVTTPDHLWKVHIYAKDPRKAYAWYMPNDGEAKPADAQRYRISLAELRAKTSDDFDWPFPDGLTDGPAQDPYAKLTCSIK